MVLFVRRVRSQDQPVDRVVATVGPAGTVTGLDRRGRRTDEQKRLVLLASSLVPSWVPTRTLHTIILGKVINVLPV